MSLNENFTELKTKFQAHVVVEEKWQGRIEEALKQNNSCHLDLKSAINDTQKGIWWIRAMILALLVFIPTISGLLVYIFNTHPHPGG